MKKAVLLLVNCILLAGCLGYLFLKPVLSGPISFDLGDEEELAVLTEQNREAAEPFFTELLFSGEKLPYDKTTSSFYLPLDMETEAWETGVLTSAQSGVRLLFVNDFTKADKQEAIRTGEGFAFYAVRDGEYQRCRLVVTGLSVIGIETTETADTEVFGGMAYFWDASTKKSWTSSNILEAHIRGNTSRTYPKKGYKLTLKTQDREGNVVSDKRSLFGMRKDDEWILNAMYSDSSRIRDKLSWDVWNSFGSRLAEFPDAVFGSNFTYVEVFFNNEYWGLYGLMEPVDSKQLDLTKEGEPGLTEYSYKSITPQNIPTEELLELPEYGVSLAGYELKGVHSTIEKEDWEPLLTYLQVRDLTDDETFRQEAVQIADIQNALNVWIYLQAVIGIDNRGKNMYYVAKSINDLHKIYISPWDMDITWGDSLSEGTGEAVWDVGLNSSLYSERINWSFGDRLVELDVDGARDRVARTWKELREGVLSDEALSSSIQSLIHQVQDSGAGARSQKRWPESSGGEDYDRFRRMALYRLHILDYYFDGRLEAYMGLGYE